MACSFGEEGSFCQAEEVELVGEGSKEEVMLLDGDDAWRL